MENLDFMRRIALFVALLVGVSVLGGPAWAELPLRWGRAFEPKAKSRPIYGTQAPDVNPDKQRHIVEGVDGVDLFVETWLPAEKAGRKPPKKVPTILIMTPYVVQGGERYGPHADNMPDSFISYMTARGYAVAQHHVRGTGESGGCLEQTAEKQIDDGARVVEYLGKDAPWSNGRVGMFGRSYDAETQISTAGYGDPDKIKYLKAIVPTASVGSQYDWNFMDGVNWTGQPAIGNAGYFLTSFETFAPQHVPERLPCQAEVMASSADTTGDYTEYWRIREYRPGAPKIKAPTFYIHGLRDFNVQSITLAGWFNELPKTTPHKGLFGVWDHAFPNHHPDGVSAWTRVDFMEATTAWFDRYLKQLQTGVEKWPAVQVQSSQGQWWTAPEFPTSRGPLGQLALGPDGTLGATKPTGSSSYFEQPEEGQPSSDQNLVFETKAAKKRLHITGQPVLDAWLTTNTGDGHVAVELEVLGKNGDPLLHAGSWGEAVATYGVRSLQHIKPMKRGFFEQEMFEVAPVDTPIRTTIRFLPSDLVVPRGGTLRLTVSGSVAYTKGSSQPSGVPSEITLLHDCDNPSVLRFLMPNPRAELRNVREPREKGRLHSDRGVIGRRTGGGIATAKVCGKAPQPNPFLTGNFR